MVNLNYFYNFNITSYLLLNSPTLLTQIWWGILQFHHALLSFAIILMVDSKSLISSKIIIVSFFSSNVEIINQKLRINKL